MEIIIALIVGVLIGGGFSLVFQPGEGSRMAAIANGDYLGFPRSYPGPSEPAESDSPPIID